jgi:DNA-binding response OmpR family regulator
MIQTKILFVDDDILLGQIVTVALQEEGYEVHYQTSALGLMETIKAFQPALILLDVEIGADDGIQLVPTLRTVNATVPIIFVSSHIESSEVIRALKAGAVTYLKKPFQIEELIAYIERYATSNSSYRITFGAFELSLKDRWLLHQGNQIKRLTKLEFALLKLLLEHKNEYVDRKEIEKLWQGSIMSEHSLYNYIVRLRKLLTLDTRLAIVTLAEKGYMLQETINL